MTWFKVDDQLANHPKARAAGLPAMGLWAVAGAWSSGYLKNGFVPDWYVTSWPQGRKLAERLVSANLWTIAEGGWQFHEWEQWQPTREQVEAEREATRKRVERWRNERRKNGDGNGVTEGVTNGVSNGVGTPAPTRPDPTRPVVTKVTTSVEARRRATQLSDEWEPNDHHRSLAAERRVNIGDEQAKFRDYYRATGKPMKDWDATFNNWIRNSRAGVTPIRADTGRAPDDMRIDWPEDPK